MQSHSFSLVASFFHPLFLLARHAAVIQPFFRRQNRFVKILSPFYLSFTFSLYFALSLACSTFSPNFAALDDRRVTKVHWISWGTFLLFPLPITAKILGENHKECLSRKIADHSRLILRTILWRRNNISLILQRLSRTSFVRLKIGIRKYNESNAKLIRVW